jgi:peptidase MA superfamily protein
MKIRRLALLCVLLAAGCGSPVIPATPSSPTLPAQSAPGPSSVAPSVDPAVAEIQALLGQMAAAVLAGDRDGYLALVDQADPVFAVEHERWAIDWSGRNPVTAYSLELADVQRDGDSATGLLTVEWALDPSLSSEPPRTTTFLARFSHGSSGWRYAGEAWASTEVPHFVVRVAPGLEGTVPGIVDVLPGIFGDVTTAVGYEPAGALEIKLYADANALVANTLLSLPRISGWNEPGEALKLVNRADGPPLAPTIAHELTHFTLFDRAGTQRTRMPWWLDEGIATFVASQMDGSNAEAGLGQVVAWESEGALAPWEDMAVFEETPVELWEFVYPQGYAMVAFVTERFGAERRNDWLAAMATEMDIDAATPAELGRSFDELDAEFRDWLAAQR